MTVGTWFGVRTLYKWESLAGLEGRTYEERITLWQSRDHDSAIDAAEVEAHSYEEFGPEYLDFAQSFEIKFDENRPLRLTEGVEVFSLLRRSNLEPDDFIQEFFNRDLGPHGDYHPVG